MSKGGFGVEVGGGDGAGQRAQTTSSSLGIRIGMVSAAPRPAKPNPNSQRFPSLQPNLRGAASVDLDTKDFDLASPSELISIAMGNIDDLPISEHDFEWR